MEVLPLPFTTHTYFIRSLDSGTKGLTNLPWAAWAAWADGKRPPGKGVIVQAIAPSPLGVEGAGEWQPLLPGERTALSVPRGSTLNLPPPQLLRAPG